MNSLYDRAEVHKLRQRSRISRALAWGLLAASVIACVILCTRVKTGNDRRLLAWVIGLSTAGGWTAILLLRLLSRPARIVSSHMEGILNNPEESCHAGVLRLLPGTVSIPGSIDIRKAELTDGDSRTALNVLAVKAGQLPPDGARVRVRAVRGYIVGFEVEA